MSSNTTKANNTKKPSVLIIIFIILLFIGGIGIICVSSFSKQSPFIELEDLHERVIEENYEIIRSSDRFEELSFSSDQYQLNFDQYNYVLIQINDFSCGEEDVEPVRYSINEKTVTIKYEYTTTCESCFLTGVYPETYHYYLLPISKRFNIEEVNMTYKSRNKVKCPHETMVEKPMIYLYPEEQTEVFVELGHPELLKVSYPTYQNGWKVTAKPDGTLSINQREYYGLFWEGKNHTGKVHEEGFVVAGKDTISFLEKQLKVLGLNDKEANEFIVYWYPTLKNNSYNYIYFETQEEIEEYMPLMIQPTPQSIIRIQMDYKPLSNPIPVTEQVLNTPQRDGFTVVEWGGSLIKD